MIHTSLAVHQPEILRGGKKEPHVGGAGTYMRRGVRVAPNNSQITSSHGHVKHSLELTFAARPLKRNRAGGLLAQKRPGVAEDTQKTPLAPMTYEGRFRIAIGFAEIADQGRTNCSA